MAAGVRFGKEDFREGNISLERIREIIRSVIYYVDPKLADNPVVALEANKMINGLVKEFNFKKYEPGAVPSDIDAQRELANTYFTQLKRCNENQFINLINRGNIELALFERAIKEHMKKQAIESYLAAQDRRARRMSENYNAELAEFDNAKAQLAELAKKRAEAMENLEELINHRNNLIISIDEHKKAIKTSRDFHTSEIVIHAQGLQVGNVKSFEGMSDQQVHRFVQGRLEILEVKIRLRAEIERQIKAEIEAETLRLGPTTLREMHDIERRVRGKYKGALYNLDVEEFRKVRELGKQTGHKYITTDVPEKTSKEHIAAFDNHKEISKSLKAHSQVTETAINTILDAQVELTSTIEKIEEYKNELSNTIEEENALLEQWKEFNKSSSANSEQKYTDELDSLEDFLNFDINEIDSNNTENAGLKIKESAIGLPEKENALYQLKSMSDFDVSGSNAPSLGQVLPSESLKRSSQKI